LDGGDIGIKIDRNQRCRDAGLAIMWAVKECPMQLAVITLAIIAFTGTAKAQENLGNAVEGKKVAEQVCAQCHDVTGDDKARNSSGNAPAFIVLARSPDHSPQSIRRYLNLPHGRMINLMVTGREADDVVCYIESLNNR